MSSRFSGRDGARGQLAPRAGGLALLLLIAGCPGQGRLDGGAPDAGSAKDWLVVDGYTASTPAVAGHMVLSPEGLELAPGQVAQLRATLYPAGAAAITSWVSSSPEVLEVDSTGQVTARAEGLAEILATDTSMRIAFLSITVTPSPAAGATGIAFETPVLALAQGERVRLAYALTDARGDPVQGPTPVFEAERPGVVTIEAEGYISGSGAGGTRIFARLAAETSYLSGTQTIAVRPTGAQPDGTLLFGSCSYMATPYAFGRPGLSGLLRVVVQRFRWGAGALGAMEVTQEAPSSVRTAVPGVVAGGAGVLTSVAPGSTRLATFVDQALCDSSIASVFPDLTGDWTGTCSNQDQAQLSLAVTYPGRDFVSVRRKVTTRDGTGAATALALSSRSRSLRGWSPAPAGPSSSPRVPDGVRAMRLPEGERLEENRHHDRAAKTANDVPRIPGAREERRVEA